MKIITLVENTTKADFKVTHGLSFYIETKNHKILFDLGPDTTILENAEKCNVDLSEVDTVIISHGHSDHGGALENFLNINEKAKVYIQKSAFNPYYSITPNSKNYIGLNTNFESHPQVILLDGDHKIDNFLTLFTVEQNDEYRSEINNNLYDENGLDRFSHEQNLMINDEKNVLIMGCGHIGIVNIMEKARQFDPEICIGGYHLSSPATGKFVSESFLDTIVEKLTPHNKMNFYSCHCTGAEVFDYLSKKMPNLHKLTCGDELCF